MLNEDLPVPATGAVAPSPGLRAALEDERLRGREIELLSRFPPPADLVVTPFATPERPTLMSLLEQLTAADDAIARPDFDPVLLAGELRGKVDALKFVTDRMDAVEKFLRGVAKPIAAKASAIKNNRERLRKYIAESMRSQKFEKIPGETFEVVLMDSPPALIMERSATAEDFEKFPCHVEMVRIYRWREDKIKDEILAGVELAGIPAKITVGCYPNFRVLVPDQLQRKSKRSKKTT